MEKVRIFKHFFKLLLIIFMLGMLGYLFLVGAYALPTDSMEIHMQESYEIFQHEGTYPEVMQGQTLDNFTDAWMLLIASHKKQDMAYTSAINAQSYRVEGKNPVDSILDLYSGKWNNVRIINYARYWHGYLIFLKPLLMLFNYGEIRNVIMIIQIILFSLVLLKLHEKSIKLCVPFLMSWVFLNPVTIMLSLQYNSIIMISTGAMLAVLWADTKWQHEKYYIWSLFFCVVGAITSYFDLLTYPLITLGFPLVLWIGLDFSPNILTNIKRVVWLTFSWGIGYVGLWAFKWILGSIITRKNIVIDAIRQLIVRTSTTVSEYTITYLDVLEVQWNRVSKITVIVILVVVVIMILRFIYMKCRIEWNYIIVALLIGVLPYIWYFVLKNHSYIHSWFTYRELGVCVYAMLNCIFLCGDETNG